MKIDEMMKKSESSSFTNINTINPKTYTYDWVLQIYWNTTTNEYQEELRKKEIYLSRLINK